MRLYFVKSPCRKCDHNHLSWISESQRKAAFQQPPNEVLAVYTCTRAGCGEDVPLLARHLREGTFDHHRTQAVAQNPRLRNLRLSPDVAPALPALTARQRKVCALILEGKSDRAIARALFIAKPTVRKELRRAASVLCADEPIACRVMPRQTVVAYFSTRTAAEPEEVFRIPA
jgi:DNA-binding CsgD family transcriptional regulator